MKNMEKWSFLQKYCAKRWIFVPVIVVFSQIILFISYGMGLSADMVSEESVPPDYHHFDG